MRKAAVVLACLGLLACGKVLAIEPDAVEDPCAAPNVCECTVASQLFDCPGAHKICDETSTPGRVCACAPAYKDNGSGTCEFDAAPFDGGFTQATSWTPVGQGASINVAAPGSVDPGEGSLNRVGICQFGGFNQTFTMPPFELADQFKITVTHSGNDPAGFEIPNGTVVAVGVNGEFKESLVMRNAFKTESFCLGPRAYGQGPIGSPVLFQVAAQTGQFAGLLCDGTSEATIQIDRVALEVAAPGECPAAGTLINGDFETDDVWTFNAVQSATGAIVAGAGESASRGATLTTANKCSEVTMTGQVAFPSTILHPAIDVHFSGTFGGRLVMQVAGQNLATLNGAAAAHKRICLPEWTRGITTSIGFFLQRASDNGCATARNQTFTVDNLTITDDPSCTGSDLTDSGFELFSTANGPEIGWGLTNGFVNDIEGSQALITNIGQRTGNSALRLIGSHECVGVGDGGADFTINVPASEGTAGPAIKFFANVGNGNLKTISRIAIQPGPTFQNPGLKLDLPEVGVYQPAVFCLPPSTSGRRMTFRFSTGDVDGGGCGPTEYPDEVALIDDVEVTTDASCPAQ